MTPSQKLESFIEFLKTFAQPNKEQDIISYGLCVNSSKQKLVRKNGRFFKQERYFTFTFDFSEYDFSNSKSVFLEVKKFSSANEKVSKASAFKSFKTYNQLSDYNINKIFECLDKYFFIKGTYKEDFEKFLNKKELYLKLDATLETKGKTEKKVKI